MTDDPSTVSGPPAHDQRRHQRHQRLYVALQSVGWLSFLGMNLFFAHYLAPEHEGGAPTSAHVRVVLLGWLLTHYARRPMQRWRWKELPWVALVPRALGMAVALSLLWSAVSFGFEFGALQTPWPEKYPPLALISISVVNGSVLMVGWLCLYFCYHVFARFDSSEIERLRLEASVKDAELRALKAQVNPHFMFNALNRVRALIDEDPPRARQAVTQLANLLRYSLQSGALQTVPFANELQVVTDYLALEQVRHEERLRIRIDVSTEVLPLHLPPMLLQTLVENAVKYGISQRPGGGEIVIWARREPGQLVLRVTNPGRIRARTETRGGRSSTGVGLLNAAHRLQLLYGEQAHLRLLQAAHDTVAAEVVVPLEDYEIAPPMPATERGAAHNLLGSR